MDSSSAQALQEEGIKLYRQKEYEEAARVFQQAHEAYTAVDQPDMAAEMQTNIGLVHRALGEYQQAIDVMRVALKTFQELGDVRRSAMVLGNLGGVYKELGDNEQAYVCYTQAADAFEELGEKKHYADTMMAIGALQVADGKFIAGASTYEIGLDNLEKLSPPQKLLKWVIGIRNRVSGS